MSWQKVGLVLGWLVIGGLSGCSVVENELSLPLSEEKIAKKAKEFTVIIDGCGAGSGAIFKREGNTYSVLTAYHVVEKSWTCLILTSDQESYPVKGDTITQPLPEVDLGVLTFTSDKSYPVAKLGDSEKMVEATSVLVVGAPGISEAIPTRTLLFNSGKIIGRVPQPKDGYILIYDAITQPGMSGGPVLNDRGEIVGVHGQGDLNERGMKTGWNLGIPIQIFPNEEKEEKNDGDYIDRLITMLNWQNIPMRLRIAIGGIIFVIVVLVVLVFVWIYRIIHYNRRVEYKKPEFNSAANSTKSIGKDNKSAVDYCSQGLRNYKLKKYDLAIADYKKAIQLDNNYTYAYHNRGLAYYKRKKYDLAIADYNKAIALDPNLAMAYNGRGLAYYYLKKYDLAIADYNKAIALDPNFAYAYNNRGNVYDKQKKYELAIADYTESLRLNNPEAWLVYTGRGLAYYYLKKYDLAIADYNKAIELNNNNAWVYYRRGNSYKELKKHQISIKDYTKAINLNSSLTDAYFYRGNIYYELKKYALAIADYTKSIEQNQSDSAAYNNRGLAYYDLKKYDLAIADYNQAIELDRNYAHPYYNLGLIAETTGDIQTAIKNYEKAAALYQQQGDDIWYQNAMSNLKKLRGY